jgi:thymidylate synthase
MQRYLEIMNNLVQKFDSGMIKEDRTGTGTVSVFGTQSYFDLSEGKVPLVTTKKLHLKSIIKELLWIISGSTNNNDLEKDGVTIWKEWATETGDLGPLYGKQWRAWDAGKLLKEKNIIPNLAFDGKPFIIDSIGPEEYNYTYQFVDKKIDQLQMAIGTIERNPYSRRNIVSAWNPSVIPDTSFTPQENVILGKQCLPAYHAFFQFNCEKIPFTARLDLLKDLIDLVKIRNVSGDPNYWNEIFKDFDIPENYLDCQVYVRSNDWFLGAPYNIAMYGILTHIIGRLTNTYPRELIYTTGDTHLYVNHIEQAKEQLKRKPHKEEPKIILNDKNWINIDSVRYEDIVIENYNPDPAIKALVAI